MSLLTSAVAAVIVDPVGRVLLCQQSQGHRLWGLPGGKIRNGESPIHAVVRDVLEETGAEIEIVDLVGIYNLTSNGAGPELPDVLMHAFRARVASGDVAVNSPGRICRLTWHEPDALPERMTATTRAAIVDALAGRSGVLRDVHRDAEPDVPEAAEPADVDAALIAA
jgi:ADP-ribose pyrophosphatase YjhB (NUDIX family)